MVRYEVCAVVGCCALTCGGGDGDGGAGVGLVGCGDLGRRVG